MTLTIFALCAWSATQNAALKTDYNPFQIHLIGAQSREAFLHPDRITIQRVFPMLRRAQHPDPTHPRLRKLGHEFIVPVGQPHTLTKAEQQRLIASLGKPEYGGSKSCIFHADHLIRFTKGNTVVEAMTCFTCEEIISFVGGAQKGRTSFYPKKDPVFPGIWKFCTKEEDARAFYGELGNEKIVDALLKGAKSGTVQYADGVPPVKFYKVRFWKDAKLSRTKELPRPLVAEIVKYLIETPGASPLTKTPYSKQYPSRTDGWRITLNTKPKIVLTCGVGFVNGIKLGNDQELTWGFGYRLGYQFHKDFLAVK